MSDENEVQGIDFEADIKEAELFEEGSQKSAEEGLEGDPKIIDEFKLFFNGLNVRNFSYSEFLYAGGSHYSGKCKNLNTMPPKSMWSNIASTAHVLDELRERLGVGIRLTSIYRSPPYNRCLEGTAMKSLHMQFHAADFIAGNAQGPGHWAAMLRKMRDDESMFKGGIGIYKTFVHIDTRGSNADWDKR